MDSGSSLSSFDLTSVVLTRNHEAFLLDALESIEAQLPSDVEVIVVDIGSNDETVQLVHEYSHTATRQILLKSLDIPPFTTVHALQSLKGAIKTSWVSLLSGDDLLGDRYFEEVSHFVNSRDIFNVLNFQLCVVDQNLTFVRHSAPRWSSISWLDRLLMMYENPGKAPGALLPWRLLEDSAFMRFSPRCLIEDHLIWLSLRDAVHFSRSRRGKVLYRRHLDSLSSQSQNPELAWSLGYCSGVTQACCQSIPQRYAYRSGKSRWRAQIALRYQPMFDAGYLFAKNNPPDV
jgi:glycosyltransferase involved in cell wall biosynthesis